MGGKNSIPIDAVDGFTQEEVARLHKRFRKLDKDASETLCVEEFLALPELKENPLVQRVVQVFDTNKSGELGNDHSRIFHKGCIQKNGGWVSRGPFSTFFKNCLNGFWKPNDQFKSIKFFHLFG